MASYPTITDLGERLAERVQAIDERMEALLTTPTDACPPRLQDAMRYACLGGGKRLRPLMVIASADAALGESNGRNGHGGHDGDHGHTPAGRAFNRAVWNTAVAIEMLHAFSLVHDDLPAMDDDDLRRGRPTVHKAYDEATAILAGDALSVRSFEVLADPEIPTHVTAQLVRELAEGIGWCGVIAGQVLDLQAEGQPATAEMVRNIHRLKTAALMRVSCRCGAIAAEAPPQLVARLGEFGELLGLAFQAADDVLDETVDEVAAGKRTGKDRARGKATLPAAIGLHQAAEQAREYLAQAFVLLEPLGDRAHLLRYLAQRVSKQLRI